MCKCEPYGGQFYFFSSLGIPFVSLSSLLHSSQRVSISNYSMLKGLYLSCSHPMCFECLRGFGAQKIEMRQLVTCPTCQEPVPHTDISRVFDRKEVKKYIGIEALSIRNNDDEKLFNCQTPDCEYILSGDS